MKVWELYYLVNDFEFTRIKDVRSETLEDKKEMKIDQEYKFDIVDWSLLKSNYRLGFTNQDKIQESNLELFS